MQFGVVAAGGIVAIGKETEASSLEEAPMPIEIDILEDAERWEDPGPIYGAVELLLISISGCGQKR